MGVGLVFFEIDAAGAAGEYVMDEFCRRLTNQFMLTELIVDLMGSDEERRKAASPPVNRMEKALETASSQVDAMRTFFAATMQSMKVPMVNMDELTALREVASAVDQGRDPSLTLAKLKQALCKQAK